MSNRTPIQDFTRLILLGTGLAFLLAVAAATGIYFLFRDAHFAFLDRNSGAQAVYATQCARCHGAALEGQPDWRRANAQGRLPAPPLDGGGHAWRHSDDELFHMIKFSLADQAGPDYQTDMPAFAGVLTDAQIRDLVAFIKSKWPANVRTAQALLHPVPGAPPVTPPPGWTLPQDCGEPVRHSRPAGASPSR